MTPSPSRGLGNAEGVSNNSEQRPRNHTGEPEHLKAQLNTPEVNENVASQHDTERLHADSNEVDGGGQASTHAEKLRSPDLAITRFANEHQVLLDETAEFRKELLKQQTSTATTIQSLEGTVAKLKSDLIAEQKKQSVPGRNDVKAYLGKLKQEIQAKGNAALQAHRLKMDASYKQQYEQARQKIASSHNILHDQYVAMRAKATNLEQELAHTKAELNWFQGRVRAGPATLNTRKPLNRKHATMLGTPERNNAHTGAASKRRKLESHG